MDVGEGMVDAYTRRIKSVVSNSSHAVEDNKLLQSLARIKSSVTYFRHT